MEPGPIQAFPQPSIRGCCSLPQYRMTVKPYYGNTVLRCCCIHRVVVRFCMASHCDSLHLRVRFTMAPRGGLLDQHLRSAGQGDEPASEFLDDLREAEGSCQPCGAARWRSAPPQWRSATTRACDRQTHREGGQIADTARPLEGWRVLMGHDDRCHKAHNGPFVANPSHTPSTRRLR